MATYAEGTSSSHPQRKRKSNFSHNEIMLLLEQVSENKKVLLSSSTTDLTKAKKNVVWQAVAKRVSQAGDCVGGRTAAEIREKWSGLKKKFLVREAVRRKTGNAGVPPYPYESLLLKIVGRESDVTEGIEPIERELFSDRASQDSKCVATQNTKRSEETRHMHHGHSASIHCGDGSTVKRASACTYSAPECHAEGQVQHFNISLVNTVSPAQDAPVIAAGVENQRQVLSPESRAPSPEPRGSSVKPKLDRRKRPADIMEHPFLLDYFKTLTDRQKLAMEKDKVAIARDRQVTCYYAIATEVAKLKKQKLEYELEDKLKNV